MANELDRWPGRIGESSENGGVGLDGDESEVEGEESGCFVDVVVEERGPVTIGLRRNDVWCECGD